MQDLNALSLAELFAALTADGSLDRLVDAALAEDLGGDAEGAGIASDVTSRSIIDPEATAEAFIVARSPGVAAGLACADRICGDGVRCTLLHRDGEAFAAGAALARIEGSLQRMLAIERTLLNIVGRLCGIATLTRRYVDAIASARCDSDRRPVICDTRKTTPGMRSLEKYAVRCGGGTLHRVGLFDAALYKDNHLAGVPLKALAETIRTAAQRVRQKHRVRFVEVEADSLDQLRELLALEAGVIDIALLDNMPPEMLRRAVTMRDEAAPHLQLEASGGVTLETVGGIAETGVDRISVGAITHSAPSLDIGLDIRPAPH